MMIEDLQKLKDEYRTLAKLYHPDNGGSLEAMQKVNEWYERSKESINSGGEAYSFGAEQRDTSNTSYVYTETTNKSAERAMNGVRGFIGLAFTLAKWALLSAVVAFIGLIAYHHLSGDRARNIKANEAYWAKQKAKKYKASTPKGLDTDNSPLAKRTRVQLIKKGREAKGDIQCYELY